MKGRELCGAARIALVAGLLVPGMALAQQQPAPPAEETEDEVAERGIVVTGTRITASGYTAPTPVTVVGEEIIQRDAKVSIGDTIRELPSVGASASPNNGAGAGNIVGGITGLDTVNLRQLGVTRTLVLFDGQRVTQSNVTGQVDIGTMPTMLVQRIDVVTGGASAAWGSDAVAGVVNLVLNRRFDGLRVSAEAGESYAFDQRNYRLQMAAGTAFGGDRGRLIFAANHQDSPDTIFANQRSWNRQRQLVNNPAFAVGNGQPRLIHADFVSLSGATTGGIIANTAANPTALRNITFNGPNAELGRFQPAIVSGGVAAGGNVDLLHPQISNLTTEFRATTLFGYAAYQFTDWLRVSLMGNYGQTRARNNSVPYTRLGNIVVRIDNAFLPQSIREQMTQLGVTQINVGTTNMNNIAPGRFSLDEFERSLGIPVAVTERTLKRGVLALEGDLGGGWSYNVYGQIGKVIVNQNTSNNTVIARYNRAVDAVRLADGRIVCRVNAVPGPNNDPNCVPLNIFGNGVASPEAIAYTNTRPGENFQRQDLEQQVYAATIQGVLPFGLPAGNIATAFGVEYRTEDGVITVDPGAAARIYPVANFVPFDGRYNVKEGFLELDVPVVKDGFVDALNLNGAVRVTDYSTSGTVTTWKVGLTTDVSSEFRFRTTYSRDIRAPNLNELFSRGIATQAQVRDPRLGPTSPLFTVFSVVEGNRNLQPEVARTFAAGVVLQPAFLNRFSLSVDYYNIALSGSIETVSLAQVEGRCVAGEQIFCSLYVYGGPNGTLSEVRRAPLNLASRKTSGIDFQADWRVPLFSGDLSFRLLGNYVLTGTQELFGVINSFVGSLGPDSAVTGFPRARATLAATYASGPFSGTVQGRFIGAAKLNVDWGPLDVDDNDIPAIFYVDLRSSYQLSEQIQFFGAVDNLLNKAPPNVAAGPTRGFSATYFAPIRSDIHDQIGRAYRIGVRAKF